MKRMLQTLGLMAAVWAGAGCHGCDTCLDVGGPCGLYNLAGRDLPPPLVPDVAKKEDQDKKKTAQRGTRQTAGNTLMDRWR